MADIRFLIYQHKYLPDDPLKLVALCKQYDVRGLSFKLLEGRLPAAAAWPDSKLKPYFATLRENGITVEGWGYHYPENSGVQGDMIQERQTKFDLPVYHVDIEKEFEQPYGMPKALETMLAGKLKKNGFEVLICTARFPSQHPNLPLSKANNLVEVDGFSPQDYWAVAHNPIEQTDQMFAEYLEITDKVIYPMGPTFGETFKVGGQDVYWEPTVEELTNFRQHCINSGVTRIYYFSLDWVLRKNRFDLLEAATGVNNGTPPPVPVSLYTISNCKYLNGRVTPDYIASGLNIIITLKAGLQVHNENKQDGSWRLVSLGEYSFWMHEAYLN